MKKMLKNLYNLRSKLIMWNGEKKNIKRKKDLISKVSLDKNQIKAIDDIWIKNYGKKIPYEWHRLYTSYMGKFDEKYFPEIFFTTNLLYKLNPEKRRIFLADKIISTYYFKDIKNERFKLPQNYIYNCNGYYYEENGIIDKEKAINKIYNIGEVIIKPSVDSSSGNKVNLLNIKEGKDLISNMSINDILKEYGKNFIIQEKIKQHKDFSKINPSSVNTIRINTYICEGKVYCSPIVMRIGRDGKIVDNAHAGGIAVGLDENGILKKYAFSEMGEKFTKHPNTNIKFEGYKLPKIGEMVEFTKKYHYRVPHMGIIAWDLALDENENIVIIEINISCPGIWLPQYVNGQSFFGDNTEKMIRMLKNKDGIEL